MAEQVPGTMYISAPPGRKYFWGFKDEESGSIVVSFVVWFYYWVKIRIYN
jgi:hypothetical protein